MNSHIETFCDSIFSEAPNVLRSKFCNRLRVFSLEYGDFIWLKFIPFPKLLLHSKEFKRSLVIFEHFT